MKRAAILWLWLGLFWCATRTHGGEAERLMLWELQDTLAPMYLLGTVHVLQPQDYPLPPEIERVFRESTRVVFEVNLDELTSTENQTRLLELALYLSGGSLTEDLSTKTYARLTEYVRTHGMEFLGLPIPLPLEMFRPWYISARINLSEGLKLGYDAELGPDLVLFERAKADGKTLVALETVAFQLGVLTGGSASEQDRELGRTLEGVPTLGEELGRIVGAWRHGDVESLRQLLHREEQTDPAAFERLITARNRAWVEQIEALLGTSQPTLVVGGVGHMVGATGVPNQLRLRRHRIRQLPVLAEDAHLPRLQFAGMPAGEAMALEMRVPVGWSFALQESSNLVEWRTLMTFFSTNEVHRLTPLGTEGRAVSFFRLSSPP